MSYDVEAMLRSFTSGPGGPAMPEMITPQTARHRANIACKAVVHDWQLLRDILDRHEATVYKRWAKKTKQQRTKILLSSWPDMSLHHRPDFTSFMRETPEERKTGSRFLEAYTWPYINQEDLSKPQTLPLFLNARGHNLPSVFALVDYNAAHLGAGKSTSQH